MNQVIGLIVFFVCFFLAAWWEKAEKARRREEAKTNQIAEGVRRGLAGGCACGCRPH